MAGRGARLRRCARRAERVLTIDDKQATVRRLKARIFQIERAYVKVIPQLRAHIARLEAAGASTSA
jgi:hypothetical protein